MIMRFGATPCFFSSRVSKRLAALVLRRFQNRCYCIPRLSAQEIPS